MHTKVILTFFKFDYSLGRVLTESLEPDAVESHTDGPLQLCFLIFVQLFVSMSALVFLTLA